MNKTNRDNEDTYMYIDSIKTTFVSREHFFS